MFIEYAYSAPLYILISPMSSYAILDVLARSSAQHARVGFIMASISILAGELAAVVQSSVVLHPYGYVVAPTITTSIVCGVCQMMLVLNKSDIPRVMLCTACAVICGVLAFVPLLSSNSIGIRCYQGCVFPILFLYWQTLDRNAAT